MKTPSLLIKNGTLAALERTAKGPTCRILAKHSILIEDGRISRIAPARSLKSAGARVIDADGKIVMPGLINAHMHFYSTLVRGLGKAKPSADFPEVLRNLWWRLDRKLKPRDIYVSAMIPLLDAIRKGTTTLIDHHASPGSVEGSLDIIADAVLASGLRASLCYETSDRDGARVTEQGLRENARFIQRCRSEDSPRLAAMFGLHASFTVSDKTLLRAVEDALNSGVGFHVHTAEDLSDQQHCLRKYGKRVVQRFSEFGLLGPKTICAHGVHLNDSEMRLLAESGTSLVHNPQSNMNNAVGMADLPRLKKHGVFVGLGTDAMTVNMFEEARAALFAQHLARKNPNAAFAEALETVLYNNAVIADRQFGLGLGQLREGAAADLILIDYHAPTPLDASNFMGHFCFGLAQSQVNTTIASGRVLMHDKQLLLDIDEEKLAAESRELARSLWRRF